MRKDKQIFSQSVVKELNNFIRDFIFFSEKNIEDFLKDNNWDIFLVRKEVVYNKPSSYSFDSKELFINSISYTFFKDTEICYKSDYFENENMIFFDIMVWIDKDSISISRHIDTDNNFIEEMKEYETLNYFVLEDLNLSFLTLLEDFKKILYDFFKVSLSKP